MKNVGGIDRVVRVVVGLALVVAAASGLVGVWGWIGLLPLATGTLGFCPAYKLIGLNTCPFRK